MKTIFNILEEKHYVWIWVTCITFVCVISVVNNQFLTTVSLEPLLLLPVVIASWYGNLITGLSVSFISALAIIVSYDRASLAIPSTDAVCTALVYLSALCILSILINNFSNVFKVEEAAAEHDHLTGLLNTRGLTSLLEEEIARTRRYRHPFTVAYIDIDNFKTINDTKGHYGGDVILCKLAKIITKSFRESDYIGRIGGDEFVCLLPETKQPDAKVVFDKLHKNLDTAFRNEDITVTFSIGVVTFESAPPSTQTALALVDSVMYRVKKLNKNDAAFQVYSSTS
ncbi:GGDEF domain-containing protein [Alteromonas facilis]|uniref:GGDEF domain-containing protein n=1 Tax=Alteromonas facilis TaxID=2048004 RepID=UPI000C28DF5B|nr:GGDEF domain-containing protein [Alteromonas facilis]